jgi:hypothetical protein
MSHQSYGEFLTKMGQKVVQTESALWFQGSGGVYAPLTCHETITPHESEIDSLLGLAGTAARYSCPTDSGRPSHFYVCADPSYAIEKLSSNTRSKVRRGLKRCTVSPVSFTSLQELDAAELSRETMQRQNREPGAGHEDYWDRYFTAAAATESMEAWAAFNNDQLAAWLIACQFDDCINISILRSRRSMLSNYPNNALLFEFLSDAIRRDGVSMVSFGWESIRPQLDSLDDFKLSMGFEKRHVGQRIEVNRLLRPILRGRILRSLEGLAVRRSSREQFGLMAGMLKWYREQPTAVSVHTP